ncbi:2926_t:CDS:2, partial [Gigaspora rosea]
ILEKLRHPDYWRRSYCEWEVKSWTRFFNETRPDESLRACHESFVAELKTILENSKPETREAKKAISLKQDIGHKFRKHTSESLKNSWNEVVIGKENKDLKKKIKRNNEDPIPDPKKIKLFKHFSEGIEANKDFNFYVSSEHTIMELYQHLVDGHYIYIKVNRQSGKTTFITATVNLLQEKSNANELPVPDLENGSPISFIIDDFSNVFEEPLILEEFINTLLKDHSTY